MSYRHTELTPHCHEHCKEHCTVIIEQLAHLWADKPAVSTNRQNSTQLSTVNAWMYLSICASVRELPHFACLVTKWTHDYVRLAHLLSTTQKSTFFYYNVNAPLRNRYCGVVEKLTWVVSCWSMQGHKGRLWPQWGQEGWAGMCTSPATGSIRPLSPQSSSWYENTHINTHREGKMTKHMWWWYALNCIILMVSYHY